MIELINKVEATYIVNDEAEGWELEDHFEGDPRVDIWFFPPTNLYVRFEVDNKTQEPISWSRVYPIFAEQNVLWEIK